MWFVLYHRDTGHPVSQSSEPPDSIKEGLAVVEFLERPSDDLMWDDASRLFVARPQHKFVDRLDDLKADPDFMGIWRRLSDTQRTRLRRVLIRLLGGARYRRDDQPFGVMPE